MIEIPGNIISANQAAADAAVLERQRLDDIAATRIETINRGLGELGGIGSGIAPQPQEEDKGGRFGLGTIPVKNPGPQAIRQAAAAGTIEYHGADVYSIPQSQ